MPKDEFGRDLDFIPPPVTSTSSSSENFRERHSDRKDRKERRRSRSRDRERRRSRSRSRSRDRDSRRKDSGRKYHNGGRGRDYRRDSRPSKENRLSGPLLSFQDFLTTEPSVSSTEEGQKLFEDYIKDYKRRNARKFFDEHIAQDWFQELYHPERLAKEKAKNASLAQTLYNDFQTNFRNNQLPYIYLDLETSSEEMKSLEAKVNPSSLGGAALSAVANGFDLIIEKEKGRFVDNCVHISDIPTSLSRDSLTKMLQEIPGFQNMFMRPADPTNYFKRSATVFYDNVDSCQKAYDRFDHSQHGLEVKPNTKVIFKHRAPSVVLEGDRIPVDLDQSLKIVDLLDQQRSITDNFIHGILASSTNPLYKLNIVISYLRHVHSFCYYCGQHFETPERLFLSCGSVHLRSKVGTTPESEGLVFLQQLDQNIAAFMQKPLPPPENPESINFVSQDPSEDPIVKKELLVFVEKEFVLKETDAKFRCHKIDEECKKAFKGADFVVKHVMSKHKEALFKHHATKKCIESALVKHAWQLYETDPQSVFWVPPTPVVEQKEPMKPKTPSRSRSRSSDRRKSGGHPLSQGRQPYPAAAPRINDPRKLKSYKDIDDVPKGNTDFTPDYSSLLTSLEPDF